MAIAPIAISNRRGLVMHLLVRHKVSDFAKWKPVYDAHLSARQKAGLKEEHLFRNADKDVPSTKIMKIVGKGAHGVEHRFRIPACLKFQSFPLYRTGGK